MTEPRPFRFADFALLVAVVLTAAGARGAYVVLFAADAQKALPYEVQGGLSPEVTALVGTLAEHGRFEGRAPLASSAAPTAFVAPGYPWLVSLAARVTPDWPPVVRGVQVGLGALTAGLYVLFARRTFDNRAVAALAGLLCALHPFWVVNAAEVNDGTVASFLLALVVFLGARCGQSGGPSGSLLYGLSLAALALVRPALLPFAFVAAVWFLVRCRDLPRGWLYALLAFLGFANGLLPWGVRNYQAVGDVMPLVDTVYLHLWAGNAPGTNGAGMTEERMREALGEERAARLAALSEKDRYGQLAGDIGRGVTGDPAETLRRRAQAGLSFLLSGQWLEGRSPWAENSPPPGLARVAPVALLGSLLVMMLLGFVGWRGTHAWRRRAMPSSLAVVWVPLPYLLSHADLLHGPRLPLDGVLLTYAAFALVSVVPRAGAGLWAGPDDRDSR